LVTHQLHYLQAPEVSHIIVLKDGQIVEQGSFQTLQSLPNGELHRLWTEAQMTRDHDGDNTGDGSSTTSNPHALATSEAARESETQKVVLGQGKGKELITQEERSTGGVPLDVYQFYLNSNGSWVLPVLVLCSVVAAQSITVISSWWLSAWTANIFSQSVNWYLGILGALMVANAFLTGLSSTLVAFIGTRSAHNLHMISFASLMRAPMYFFDTTPIGRILNRFSKDQDTIDNLLPESFRMVLTMFCSAIFTCVIIAVVSPWFLVAFFPIAWLYYRTQDFYRNASREIKRLDAISRSPLFAHFSETLTGLSTIRAYAEEDRFIQGNQNKIDHNNRANYLQLQSQRWLALRLEVLGAAVTGCAAIIAVLVGNTLTPGQVGLSVSYALSVTGMLNWMIRTMVPCRSVCLLACFACFLIY
jgi:ABC-type multidrug transport system fused ATPase/permease subunit